MILLKNIQGKSLLFFLAASVLLRFGSFFNLMLDYDEWTYWEISLQWLSGKSLYSDLIDLKAPGIFMVFAILQKVALGQILIARILVALLLGLAAYSASRIGQILFSAPQMFTGVLFLLHFSYPMGLALNTEIFFMSFTSIGAWLFVGFSNAWIRFFGLMVMGFAFCIKVFAAADIFFLILLYSVFLYREKSESLPRTIKTFLFGSLSLLPFLALHLWYYFSENWDAFVEAIYILPGKYTQGADLKNRIDLLALYHYRFIWIVAPAYYGLYRLLKRNRPAAIIISLWMISIWFLMMLSSRLHDHYWLQLSLSMSLAGAIGLSELTVFQSLSTRKLLPFAGVGLVLSGFIFQFRHAQSVNTSLQSVNKIIPDLGTEEVLWVANGPAVFYYLQNKRCPGKYIHGSLSFDQRHALAYGIEPRMYWNEQLQTADCIVFAHGSSVDEEFFELLVKRGFKQIEAIEGFYTIWSKPPSSS